MAQGKEREGFPILIVDDEPEIVESLINYLNSYEVDFAYDADSALEKIASGRYRIVMTDIVMPGMDGIELLRRIKNINPGIQVIIMTGKTTLMRASESLQEGTLRYLLKPFDNISEIDRSIEEAINRVKSWKDVFRRTAQAKKTH